MSVPVALGAAYVKSDVKALITNAARVLTVLDFGNVCNGLDPW